MFTTSKHLLAKGQELLNFLREDQQNLAARDLHELMRCWENTHRMVQAEAHVETLLYREETRWPGYYFRADFPKLDPEWECFVNCTYNRHENTWTCVKKPIIRLFGDEADHELLGG
jgi:adenylylsulfate reductase subunit A